MLPVVVTSHLAAYATFHEFAAPCPVAGSAAVECIIIITFAASIDSPGLPLLILPSTGMNNPGCDSTEAELA
jgi:hypothetical protein